MLLEAMCASWGSKPAHPGSSVRILALQACAPWKQRAHSGALSLHVQALIPALFRERL